MNEEITIIQIINSIKTLSKVKLEFNSTVGTSGRNICFYFVFRNNSKISQSRLKTELKKQNISYIDNSGSQSPVAFIVYSV
jgi:hypothetical protein